MPVITISRQLGSLGTQVAREAAAILEYRLVWRDLINLSALRAGAPCTALAVIDDLGLLGISLSKKEVRAFRKALRQVMEELYAEGNVVIVGRAGQTILHGKPGVLHVRVVASTALRAERIAVRHNVSLKNAAAQIEASDKNRRKFLKRLFKEDWDDPQLYDLLINTTHLDASQSARIVAQAVSSMIAPDPIGTAS
jgi:cytidylate kinase